LQKLISLENI